MSEKMELKPCPFCDTSPNILTVMGTIYCPSHECFGPATTAENFADSAAQWNTRAALRASPAEGEAVDGEAAIRAAASDASPCAQIVRFEGDLLVYYSGFNLSKFVRFLARTPRAAVFPPQREVLRQLFADHYWDSFQSDRDLIMKHVDAVLALSGDEGKSE